MGEEGWGRRGGGEGWGRRGGGGGLGEEGWGKVGEEVGEEVGKGTGLSVEGVHGGKRMEGAPTALL
jgi:hypothetical protein